MEPRDASRACGAAHAGSLRTSGGSSPHRNGRLRGPWAALALVERELVAKRQWLTAAEVTKPSPIPSCYRLYVVQVVSYLGYKLGGWSGSRGKRWPSCFPSHS